MAALLWAGLTCLLAVHPVSAKSAADYYVDSLPGAPEPLLKMHAGHVEITPEHHGNMFFWHYQNRHIGDRQRTVIWLNGGPGCSSMDGAMMEIGPYRVNADGTLRYNNGSWDEFANLLFVDNPVGTGFSYVDGDSYIHELQTMADQMVAFLEQWFTIFPDYSHDDLYIAGESYAGQYIPYIGRAIQIRNVASASPWNLKGLLIGNGWISPAQQYLEYLPFAYKEGLLQGGTSQAQQVENQQAICTKQLEQMDPDNQRVDVQACEAILGEILRVASEGSGSDKTCPNMYDVRLRDTSPSCGMNWPPDLANVTPYLRKPEVLRALHIDAKQNGGWKECSGAVSGAFTATHSKPSIELLPGLLEHVPILLFSGAKDMICNHLGTEALIKNMQWNGGTGFELNGPGSEWAPKRDWTFEGEPAGIWQSARNLTYVMFYNASHMVPFDYPRRTRDMLDRFMGVDIASIGGPPADSRIDGEKGVETSVGGHPNSTQAQEEQQQQLDEATWKAYYKSGEVALVFVLIAAGAWGYFVWRGRRSRAGYRGLPKNEGSALGGLSRGLENFGRRRRPDIEAADFDIDAVDDLERSGRENHDMERDHYDIGSDDDDEGEEDSLNRTKAKEG